MNKVDENEESTGIRERLSQIHGDDLLFADGYDGAIIGVSIGFDSQRVVYSVKKMLEICVEKTGEPHESALEWLEYNTFGAYVGENTPIYVEEDFEYED